MPFSPELTHFYPSSSYVLSVVAWLIVQQLPGPNGFGTWCPMFPKSHSWLALCRCLLRLNLVKYHLLHLPFHFIPFAFCATVCSVMSWHYHCMVSSTTPSLLLEYRFHVKCLVWLLWLVDIDSNCHLLLFTITQPRSCPASIQSNRPSPISLLPPIYPSYSTCNPH